jgi:hypothetical protein
MEDLLAQLRTLHYKKLQKYCRSGTPDVPFDGLNFTSAQWASCFAEGPGCKAAILAKIALVALGPAPCSAPQPLAAPLSSKQLDALANAAVDRVGLFRKLHHLGATSLQFLAEKCGEAGIQEYAAVLHLRMKEPQLLALMMAIQRNTRREFPKHGCLFFNLKVCSKTDPTHIANCHHCICCGEIHGIRSVLLHTNESGVCPEWMEMQGQFQKLVGCFPGVDAEKLAQLLIGTVEVVSFVDQAKRSRLEREGARVCAQIAAPVPCNTERAVEVVPDAVVAERADLSEEALDAYKEIFHSNCRASHQRACGGTQSFTNAHRLVWFPQVPLPTQPLLIWCECECCRIGDDSHRNHVYAGCFFRCATNTLTDISHDVNAAVKVCHSSSRSEGMKREIRALTKLGVELLLYGSEFTLAGCTFDFIATRRHDDDIASHLQANQDLVFSDRCVVARKVLAAVVRAHKSGLTHGAIRPQNVAITTGRAFAADEAADPFEAWDVHLINLECAHAEDERRTSHPIDDELAVGWYTPMQRCSSCAKPCDDVFALALTLYEIFAYRPPHDKWKRHTTEPLLLLDGFIAAMGSHAHDTDEAYVVWRDNSVTLAITEDVKPVVEISQQGIDFFMRMLEARGSSNYKSLQPAHREVNVLAASLVRQLLTMGLTRSDHSPLKSIAGAYPHLLAIDPHRVACMMLHLVHQASHGQSPHMSIVDAIGRGSYCYFKGMDPDLVGAINATKDNGFAALDLNIPLRFRDAINVLRNLVAHPVFGVGVAVGSCMKYCPLPFEELQHQLMIHGAVFNLNTSTFDFPHSSRVEVEGD